MHTTGGLYAHPLSIHRKLPSSGAAQWHLNELAGSQNRTLKTPGSVNPKVVLMTLTQNA